MPPLPRAIVDPQMLTITVQRRLARNASMSNKHSPRTTRSSAGRVRRVRAIPAFYPAGMCRAPAGVGCDWSQPLVAPYMATIFGPGPPGLPVSGVPRRSAKRRRLILVPDVTQGFEQLHHVGADPGLVTRSGHVLRDGFKP